MIRARPARQCGPGRLSWVKSWTDCCGRTPPLTRCLLSLLLLPLLPPLLLLLPLLRHPPGNEHGIIDSAQPLPTALPRLFPHENRLQVNPTPAPKPTPPEYTEKNAETKGEGSQDAQFYNHPAHLLVGPVSPVVRVGVSRWAHLVPFAQESIESHASGWVRRREERGHRRNSVKSALVGLEGRGCTPQAIRIWRACVCALLPTSTAAVLVPYCCAALLCSVTY